MTRLDLQPPCWTCQKGYDRPHHCDVPTLCPCDREDLHINDRIDLSTKEKHVNDISKAIADLRQAVAANAPRDQFEVGTVIRWTASAQYTYAAIKTSVGWFTTARPSNPFIKNLLAYEELEEILARSETSDAAVATSWEFLDGQGERRIDVEEETTGPYRNLPGPSFMGSSFGGQDDGTYDPQSGRGL